MQLRGDFFNYILLDKVGQYTYHLPSTNFASMNLIKEWGHCKYNKKQEPLR